MNTAINPKKRRANDFENAHPVWIALNAHVSNAMPTIISACILTITGGALFTYLAVNRLVDKVKDHGEEIKVLRAEIAAARSEINEHRFELAVLRVNVNVPYQPLQKKGDK